MGILSVGGVRGVGGLVLVLGALHGVGCTPSRKEPDAVRSRTTAPVATLAVEAAKVRVSSSALALGRIAGRPYAFVADEDGHALHLVDVDRARVVSSLALPAVPGHVVVHGTRLAVSLRETREVRTVTVRGSLDAPQLTLDAEAIAAPFDPLALASDGAELVVASASSARLARAGIVTALPRDPRAVLLAADGTARVAHATGSSLTTVTAAGARSDLGLDLSAVCTEDDPDECLTLVKPPSIQSYALGLYEGSVLVPSVSTLTDGPFPVLTDVPLLGHPGRSPHVSHVSHGGYGGGGGSSSNPITFRIDVVTDGVTPGTSVLASGSRVGVHECTLPRGLAVDEASHQVWVACLGDGQVLRHEAKRTKQGLVLKPADRLAIPFVTALAYDAPSGRLLALSPFERSVTVATGQTLEAIALPAVSPDLAHDPEWEAGRRLFSSTDRRISGGKKACASCHPDGGDDGLAWDTPQGKRRTLALAGRLGDKDFGWQGNHASLELHVTRTITQNLRGKGLTAPELASLLRYVGSMQAPASRPLEGPALRGQAVFAGAGECSTCHDPAHRFSDGLVHDVGGGAFRTPSLLGIAGRGRFFHDGRYRSLEELLTRTDGRMGQTASLSPDDRAALQSYLATL